MRGGSRLLAGRMNTDGRDRIHHVRLRDTPTLDALSHLGCNPEADVMNAVPTRFPFPSTRQKDGTHRSSETLLSRSYDSQASPNWRALTMTCARSRAPSLEKI